MSDAVAEPPSAPAAVAAGPSTPAAPASAPGKQAHSLSSAFDMLDQMAGDNPAGDITPNEPAKKEDAADNTPDTKPDAKADSKPAAKPDAKSDPNGKQSAKTFREHYNQLKVERDQLQAKYEALEKSRATAAPPEEVQKLNQALESERKRAEELATELRTSNFERSPEYKEKFLQPFVDAYAKGASIMSAFKVTNPDGTERQGTPADWEAIMSLADEGTAISNIESLLGNGAKAQRILLARDKVNDLNNARMAQLESAKKNEGTLDVSRQQKQQADLKARSERWNALNQEAAKKYPDWFSEKTGDEEGNKLLARGRELAQSAFNGQMKDDKTGQPRPATPDEMVALHSAIFNQAAAFPRVVHRLKGAMARIKELETALKNYEASEPGAGSGGRPAAANGKISLDSVSDRLNKLATQ